VGVIEWSLRQALHATCSGESKAKSFKHPYISSAFKFRRSASPSILLKSLQEIDNIAADRVGR
jgi:hypothetical protein